MDPVGVMLALVLLVMVFFALYTLIRRLVFSPQWDVFVSYRSTNKKIVKSIVEHLVDEGFQAWVDWDAIPKKYGTLFRGRVSEGLQRSSCSLLFTSRQYGRSDNTLEEAIFLKKRFAHAPERIIEVRLDDNSTFERLGLPRAASCVEVGQPDHAGHEENVRRVAREIATLLRPLLAGDEKGVSDGETPGGEAFKGTLDPRE